MSFDDDKRGRGYKVSYQILEAGAFALSKYTDETPFRNLIASVLARAILDFCGHTGPGTSIQKKSDTRINKKGATVWIFSKSKDPMSFIWCCTVLDLDPYELQRQIRKIQDTKLDNATQKMLAGMGRARKKT